MASCGQDSCKRVRYVNNINSQRLHDCFRTLYGQDGFGQPRGASCYVSYLSDDCNIGAAYTGPKIHYHLESDNRD
eukprot:357492-Amphidinium_carterae.1